MSNQAQVFVKIHLHVQPSESAWRWRNERDDCPTNPTTRTPVDLWEDAVSASNFLKVSISEDSEVTWSFGGTAAATIYTNLYAWTVKSSFPTVKVMHTDYEPGTSFDMLLEVCRNKPPFLSIPCRREMRKYVGTDDTSRPNGEKQPSPISFIKFAVTLLSCVIVMLMISCNLLGGT